MSKVQTWSRLAKRAETQATNALVAVAQAKLRVDQFAASEARLHELHADYAMQLRKVESVSHTMSQNMACRRYIFHVETLLQKLAEAQTLARATLGEAREKHRRAEIERLKMQHLAERAAAQVLDARTAQEQRQMDQLAIARFNLR